MHLNLFDFHMVDVRKGARSLDSHRSDIEAGVKHQGQPPVLGRKCSSCPTSPLTAARGSMHTIWYKVDPLCLPDCTRRQAAPLQAGPHALQTLRLARATASPRMQTAARAAGARPPPRMRGHTLRRPGCQQVGHAYDCGRSASSTYPICARRGL